MRRSHEPHFEWNDISYCSSWCHRNSQLTCAFPLPSNSTRQNKCSVPWTRSLSGFPGWEFVLKSGQIMGWMGMQRKKKMASYRDGFPHEWRYSVSHCKVWWYLPKGMHENEATHWRSECWQNQKLQRSLFKWKPLSVLLHLCLKAHFNENGVFNKFL